MRRCVRFDKLLQQIDSYKLPEADRTGNKHNWNSLEPITTTAVRFSFILCSADHVNGNNDTNTGLSTGLHCGNNSVDKEISWVVIVQSVQLHTVAMGKRRSSLQINYFKLRPQRKLLI
jgi:hypothetical protein